MVDYKKAIKRPFSDLRILAISCGVLIFLGIIMMGVIFPISFLAISIESSFLTTISSLIIQILQLLIFAPFYGYVLYSAKLVMKNDFRLINWKNWRYLFKNGFFGSLIKYIYSLPLIIINLFLINAYGLSSFDFSNQELISSNLSSFLQFFLISILLFLVYLYISNMAIMMYTKNFKFADAFKFKEVFKRVFNAKWLSAWFMSIIISSLMALIAVILFAILTGIGIALPILFIIIIPVLVILLLITIFAISIVSYSIYAQAYLETGKN